MIRPTTASAISVLNRAADLRSLYGSTANAVVQLALAGTGDIQKFATIICELLETGDRRWASVDGNVPDGNGCFAMLDDKEKRRFYRAARALQMCRKL